MAVTYTELDTTSATLIKDLRTAFLTNADWTYVGHNTAIATSTVATAVNATSMTFTSGTIPAAVVVGSLLRFDTHASNIYEYRVVTAVTATTISWAGGLAYAHAIGTQVFWGNEVFKCTTVRGADMIFDLTGAGIPTHNRLAIAVYGSWTAPTGSAAGIIGNGSSNKYLHWRGGTGVAANVVHVVLSMSKDHMFLSLEGPRGSETNPTNGAYGSPRNYFFMADLVPYSTSDTNPVVVAAGTPTDALAASVLNQSYLLSVSKSINGLQNWVPAKLITLQYPSVGGAETIGVQRFTVADDQYYLSPYVVAADDAGLRGRLNNIYFAGVNYADNPEGQFPMVNAELTYNGLTYKLTPANKGDASNLAWGALGSNNNNGGSTFWRSVVIALPIA